jgi:AraC-like DNA-binding protein
MPELNSRPPTLSALSVIDLLGAKSRLGVFLNEKMPGTITSAFSEPEDFEAALSLEGCVALLITGRGEFRAQLTQVTLHRLRLSATTEQLSRIAFIAVPTDMVKVGFPIRNRSVPVRGGIGIRPGDIMTLGPGEHVHERTYGPRRWGAVWIPVQELVRYGSALTGVPFAVPRVARRWQSPPAAGRRLRSLHAAAIRMAAIRPQVFFNAETTRGLEQQLIHAVVECLTTGSIVESSPATRRNQTIMARFEQVLQTQPDRKVRMTEICAVLGVSDRWLRSLCTEYLELSPIGYDRLRRMSLVRRALRGEDRNAASVSTVARRYAFRNLGRFNPSYRAAFGELPSVALRRFGSLRQHK